VAARPQARLQRCPSVHWSLRWLHLVLKQIHPSGDQVETHSRCSLPAASRHLKLKPPPGGKDHRRYSHCSALLSRAHHHRHCCESEFLVCWETAYCYCCLAAAGPARIGGNIQPTTNPANAHARPRHSSRRTVPLRPAAPPTAQASTQSSTVSQIDTTVNRNHEAKV
jgi:hypothetical protein